MAQVFSCEFWQIFRNVFFTEHLWTTASETTTKFSRLKSIFSVEDDYSFTFNSFVSTLRSETIFGNWKPFKIYEKCFLFYFKKIFSFPRYLNFCLDFLVIQKNGSIRKISLISKFIPSQPSQQTIVLHMLPNIPRGKGNQTVKFGQLINYKTRNISL